jgi:hypothetical protein
MALISFEGSPHGGKQKLLPEWNSQPKITPTTIIDHSIVGSALGAFLYFRDSSSLESHFIVDLNGEIWQLMDTNREADANLEANAYAISIETADNGDPNNYAWTANQLASLKWLHNKLRAVHPTIPRKEATSCKSGGLGFHTKLGAPSCWTPVAKTCPGKPVRVGQWQQILLPAFLSSATVDIGGLTMADAQDVLDKLDAIYRLLAIGDDTHIYSLKKVRDQLGRLENTVGGLLDDEAKVLAAVDAVTTKVGLSEAAILGALTVLELDLTDEQVAAIAAAVNVDEVAVAEAVRFRLSEALAQ